jgi:hypothetical protein
MLLNFYDLIKTSIVYLFAYVPFHNDAVPYIAVSKLFITTEHNEYCFYI